MGLNLPCKRAVCTHVTDAKQTALFPDARREPARPKKVVAPPKRTAAKAKHDTREAWLLAAVELLTPAFAERGATVPEVRVSCGFPQGRAKAIGQCWYSAVDKVIQIFISPELADPVRVLDVLVHELVHACLGAGKGHGKEFRALATAMGLEGKMTATVAGPALKEQLKALSKDLGTYPHAKLDRHAGPKKQSTRMVKVQCTQEGCEGGGYTVRTTRKWLEVGMPACPAGCEMEEV